MDPELRSRGLGGTDIAAIVGLHPQRQAWDVFAEKTGLLERVADTTNNRMRWGKKLERLIAEAWTEVTRKDHRWCDETRIGKHPFQVYTPDAFSQADLRGIECKTAGLDQAKNWGEPGTDDVPQQYLVQCQWYMSAADFPRWDVAVLIAGNDFRIYTIERDGGIEAALLEEGERFWRQHIEPRVAPPMGNSPAVAEYLKSRFPRNLSAIRQATPEELALISEYLPVRADLKALEARAEAMENQIKASIGDSEGLSIEGGKITWKAARDSQKVDWEAAAKAAGATPELIAQFSTTKPGSRRFLVSVK